MGRLVDGIWTQLKISRPAALVSRLPPENPVETQLLQVSDGESS